MWVCKQLVDLLNRATRIVRAGILRALVDPNLSEPWADHIAVVD